MIVTGRLTHRTRGAPLRIPVPILNIPQTVVQSATRQAQSAVMMVVLVQRERNAAAQVACQPVMCAAIHSVTAHREALAITKIRPVFPQEPWLLTF